MAVSINTVYQRVLAMANKEQRGYLTPQEFNLLANQAQLEIFEQYFYDINQFNRNKGNSTEFSDMLHILEEKISAFRVNESSLISNSELITNSTFNSGITNWTDNTGANGTFTHVAPVSSNNFDGAAKLAQTANGTAVDVVSNTFTVVNNSKYIIEWSISDTNITGSAATQSYTIEVFEGATLTKKYQDLRPDVSSYSVEFVAESNTSSATVKITNNCTDDQGEFLTISNFSVRQVDNATLPTDLYRLGEVFYKETTDTYHKTVAEVNSNEVTKFNQSPLARPTTKNPAYVRSNINSITIYPTTLATGSTVTCNYIKKPAEVSWGYNVVLNKAVYNASSTTDFEFHESEEPTLVNKILLLAGIVIEKPQLSGIAGTMVNEEKQQEKS